MSEKATVTPVTTVQRRRQSKTPRPDPSTPSKLTYALQQWTAERRATGWYVAPTVASFSGSKPAWRGPFATIESACLAIARALAVEIADRHTRSVESHGIGKSDTLYGFKPTTEL